MCLMSMITPVIYDGRDQESLGVTLDKHKYIGEAVFVTPIEQSGSF